MLTHSDSLYCFTVKAFLLGASIVGGRSAGTAQPTSGSGPLGISETMLATSTIVRSASLILIAQGYPGDTPTFSEDQTAGVDYGDGDSDMDNDIDLNDYASGAGCIMGPALDVAGTPCGVFDLDGDEFVDLADFWIFQDVFTGS